jgi:hypothetical protein
MVRFMKGSRTSRLALRSLALGTLAMGVASPVAAGRVDFEGFGLPTSVGYGRHLEGQPLFTPDTPAPGFLHQADSIGTIDWWTLPASTFVSLASRSTGWVFEARCRTDGTEEGLHFGAFVEVADELGGIGLLFRLDRVEVYTAADFAASTQTSPRASIPYSPGQYHAVRVVVPGGQAGPASAHSASVFVDSVFAVNVTGLAGFNLGANNLVWGDGGSGSGLEVSWDYVHFGDAQPPPPTSYFTVTPCRVVDTRKPDGPLSGPALVAGVDRVFTVAGQCGVPVTAKAVSLNLTVTEPTAAGNLRLYPAGTSAVVSNINYVAGQTRANNTTVNLSDAGALIVHCAQASGTAHFVLDVNGYYE